MPLIYYCLRQFKMNRAELKAISTTENTPGSEKQPSVVGDKRRFDDADVNVDDADDDDNVHSANQWEAVDLGGGERNHKFLRLMGASKTEHHGRFIIGETNKKHTKAGGVTETDIEKEFEKGIDYKLTCGFKGHKGLGFHDDEKKEVESEKTVEQDNKAELEKSEKVVQKEDEKEDDKNDKTSTPQIHQSSPGIKKMSFVKASKS